MAVVRIRVDTAEPERMIRAAVKACSPPIVTKALTDAAEVYQRGISRRAPRRTGQLAGSFEIITNSPTDVEVSSGLVYARPQEEGAFIRPRSAKALRFAGTGGTRFLKWVRVKPQPYVAPTFASDSNAAFDAFADRFDRELGAG